MILTTSNWLLRVWTHVVTLWLCWRSQHPCICTQESTQVIFFFFYYPWQFVEPQLHTEFHVLCMCMRVCVCLGLSYPSCGNSSLMIWEVLPFLWCAKEVSVKSRAVKVYIYDDITLKLCRAVDTSFGFQSALLFGSESKWKHNFMFTLHLNLSSYWRWMNAWMNIVTMHITCIYCNIFLSLWLTFLLVM